MYQHAAGYAHEYISDAYSYISFIYVQYCYAMFTNDKRTTSDCLMTAVILNTKIRMTSALDRNQRQCWQVPQQLGVLAKCETLWHAAYSCHMLQVLKLEIKFWLCILSSCPWIWHLIDFAGVLHARHTSNSCDYNTRNNTSRNTKWRSFVFRKAHYFAST